MGLEGMARNRKQDIIFAILKRHAMNGEEIFGDGVLEILSDGFGFALCRRFVFSWSDDIYVSPSQIRRFNLRTGDTITGTIRPPKKVSVILLCSKLIKLTMTRQKIHVIKSYLKT